jgi:hypothetical protein
LFTGVVVRRSMGNNVVQVVCSIPIDKFVCELRRIYSFVRPSLVRIQHFAQNA